MTIEDRDMTPPTARGSRTRRSAAKNASETGNGKGLRRDLVEAELLDQASRLFAERGFAGTKLQDIADAMGLTRPALYYYVKTKDEILARLVTEVTSGPAEEIVRISAGDAVPPEKIRAMARVIAEHRASQPGRFLLVIRSESELPPDLARANNDAKRAILRALTSVIDDGVRQGYFRAVDFRTAAFAVAGMCNWVAWWFRPDAPGAQPTAVADEVADLAVSMLVRRSPKAHDGSGTAAAIAQLREDLAYLEQTLK